MSPDTTTQIKDKLDLIDYISRTVKLKKNGQNYSGLCPFHQEKTPSFTATSTRQVWHCFGCGRGGDIFSFVQERDRVDFRGALELLAQETGIEISPNSGISPSSNKRLYEIHELATQYFQQQLHQSQAGQIGLQYLIKSRQINTPLIHQFGLGFAPDSWNALGQYLLNKGFSEDELILAGLIIAKESNGWYDRFRNRVIFPIRDHQDRVVGFAGRVISKNDKTAKYINSPETPLFKKNRILFGLSLAKEAISKSGYAVLVEGPLDTIALHKIGITNVIAPQGTALTDEQLRLLKHYTDNIKIVFDQDEAGQKANLRAIGLALKNEFKIKLTILTAGTDPDDAVKNNPQQTRDDMKNSLSYYDYVKHSITGADNPDTYTYQTECTNLMLPFIRLIPNKVLQDSTLKRLSDDLGINLDSLREEFSKTNTPNTDYHYHLDSPKEPANQPKQTTPFQKSQRLWNQLSSILLQYGIQVTFDPKTRTVTEKLLKQKIPDETVSKLGLKILSSFINNPSLNDLDRVLTPDEQKLADLLILQDLGTIASSNQMLHEAINDIVHKIRIIQVKNEIKLLSDGVLSELDRHHQYQSLLKELKQLHTHD